MSSVRCLTTAWWTRGASVSLFVEDTVPLRMIGSGFVRSNDIVREMAAQGYAVTVYPINGCPFDVAGVYADMPDGVEVMHDRSTEQFQEFIARRRGYYDVIWVARTLRQPRSGSGPRWSRLSWTRPLVVSDGARRSCWTPRRSRRCARAARRH